MPECGPCQPEAIAVPVGKSVAKSTVRKNLFSVRKLVTEGLRFTVTIGRLVALTTVLTKTTSQLGIFFI